MDILDSDLGFGANDIDELRMYIKALESLLRHPDNLTSRDRYWNKKNLAMKKSAINIFARSRDDFKHILAYIREANPMEADKVCLKAICLMDSLIEPKSGIDGGFGKVS